MKQAIALAGGGTKGAYQVGAWKAMRELGVPFDIVTGTSIGSVTAALMVQGDFDRAWELWTHITEEQIMLERDDATPHEKHGACGAGRTPGAAHRARQGLGGSQPPHGGHFAVPCARAQIP
ncbi:MAG: patatin-like phospholipase family protein [Oscillospiraceae bacterium]